MSRRTTERRRGPHRRRIGVRRELIVFAGVAALTLAVIAAGAVVASRSVARTQALRESERATTRLAEQLVAPLLLEALRGDADRRDELDRAIRIRKNDGYLTEVTVWDWSGASSTPTARRK